MNRYRTLPGLGPPKATASTVCQKCLKKDIYECKATAQERPYISRPSRTQQLLNPKLVPKLASDTPNELANSKGIADQLLAEAEAKRNVSRNRSMSPDEPPVKQRSRSKSISSVDSVSTISTNKSTSRSITRRSERDIDSPERDEEQYRHRSRSRSPQRKRKFRSPSSDSMSRSPAGPSAPRFKNRRHRTNSPRDRGRPSSDRRGSHRSRSNSFSVDKSQVTKERRSLDFDHEDDERRAEGNDRRRRNEREPDRRRYRDSRQSDGPYPDRDQRPVEKRERSLSPYSRRLELTQAMNKN